jgi:FMN-binding domain
VQISSGAEPALRESALAKQSAAIDAVSGATITSASYEASLQSALDQLGFKAADGSRGSSTIPDVEEHDGGPGDDGGIPPELARP